MFRRIDWFTFGITTLLVMIGYWITLAPDLTLEDSGELAVALDVRGRAASTGLSRVDDLHLVFHLIPHSNIAWRVACRRLSPARSPAGWWR
jgi:hypothetical protein